MTQDQGLIVGVIAVTLALFIWGRWRHDTVALLALLAGVAAGVVPVDAAFAGFANPAVVTVIAVLILSAALQSTGAADTLTRRVLPRRASPAVTIAGITGLAAVLSAFMNNVGALALLMPAAIQFADREGIPPGKVLMPVAFGSILGGMTTLIGTPPNLIVSQFRAGSTGEGFGMFDFTPAGIVVALAGVAFVVVFGRWLIPTRKRAGKETFETGAYLTEARVDAGSRAAGMLLQEVDGLLEAAGAQTIALIRGEVRIPAPSAYRQVAAGDILVIEAEPDSLGTALASLGLKLVEDVEHPPAPAGAEGAAEEGEAAAGAAPPEKAGGDVEARDAIQSDEIVLAEYVVASDAELIGLSATTIRLRNRFGINLLAVSRQGQPSMSRLRSMPILGGDLLLLQGRKEALRDFASQFGVLPLAERSVRLPNPRKAIAATAIMGAAILAAAFGVLSTAIAFFAGALAVIVFRVIPERTAYRSVDWSVVVLIGAMLPVAGAFASTGAADLVAGLMLDNLPADSPVLALALVMVVTMVLTDLMNNAATAAVMCPVALEAASGLGVSADPFLMAVAIGASCAFLTPIGHQNNTLILGPGGFRFGDYWRLGLPLEALVAVIAIPALVIIWPL